MKIKTSHHKYIVGIDEAGRGPLAGPVAVGAVLVSSQNFKKFTSLFKGVKDSKKLSAKKREVWFEKILDAKRNGILNFHVSFSSSSEIDKNGIVPAISQSVAATLLDLKVYPKKSLILLDGSLHAPENFVHQKTIIRGDDTIMIISLASVAAKVLRDRLMKKFSLKYPKYGFEKHKGYGTDLHFKNIRKYGLSKIHRRSFLKKD